MGKSGLWFDKSPWDWQIEISSQLASSRKLPLHVYLLLFLKEEYGILYLNRNVKRLLFISESLKVQNTDIFFKARYANLWLVTTCIINLQYHVLFWGTLNKSFSKPCCSPEESFKCFHGINPILHAEWGMVTLTSAKHSLCLFCQLHELGVDMLVRFFQYRNQILCLLGISSGEKCVWCPSTIWTCCSTDTMHIIFRATWEVKVDDEFDVRDI